MSDATRPLLVDPKGEALISDTAVPVAALRTFDNTELTALLSGMLHTLATIHGPEVVQLVFLHAEQIENAIKDNEEQS